MGIGRSIRVLAAVYLPIGTHGCLAVPPDAAGDAGDVDTGTSDSPCGNGRLDVAYMSQFAVDPDGYGRADISRVGLVINSGAGLLDVSALEVVTASVDDDGSALTFAAYDSGGPPLEPGEARGELSSNGRDMVLATVSEDWTDPNAPELSGRLSTPREAGALRGSVVVALGPHRVTLDLEFHLQRFRGSGAYPQSATRATSTCTGPDGA